MNQLEQKQAAQAFVERWQAAEGSEDRESDNFWIELLGEVLGVPNPTYVLDRQRKVQGRKIDIFHEDVGVLIENKSRGVDLDKPEQRGFIGTGKNKVPRMVTPYEQARWYADNITPRSVAPKWIITFNFDEMRIYDLDEEYPEKCYETIELEELPELLHRLTFLTKKENSRAEREKELSVKAGEVVGKLYDALAKSYLNIETDEQEQKSLNILITRIVFLLYAEDAEIINRNSFFEYLKNFKAEHIAQALQTLFKALKTPEDERDPYMDAEALKFPYVNGGLFAQDIIIPPFTDDSRFILLQEASAEFDWKNISPTIFGAVFESTLNPETRRAGGMHYTSVENIHKVTGPLFYDELKAKLTEIENIKEENKRKFKLQEFLNKISSIKVLDPACGSGNFLTETYLSLRKFENRILENLYGGETARLFEMQPIQVSVSQFYGIEINDFAVSVAKTALWIAELQMLEQTREIMNMWIDALPLKDNNNIVCDNALRIDWSEVIPAEECNYVIGNPPFVSQGGSSDRGQRQEGAGKSSVQAEDMKRVFGNVKGAGNLDYVCCWFVLAARYMQKNPCVEAAFVSTNSICQGQQVLPLWGTLLEMGVNILFAHRSFLWNSEVSDSAFVYVVIIGFSLRDRRTKRLFSYERYKGEPRIAHVNHINPYLIADADDVIVGTRTKPLQKDTRQMVRGGGASDWGYLMVTPEERRSLINSNPGLEKWIKPFLQGSDFLKGTEAYCLWMAECSQGDLGNYPEIKGRLDAVTEKRMASKKKSTQAKAKTPWLFDEIIVIDGDGYIAVPQVSAGSRFYIPMDFIDKETIAGNKLLMVPGGGLYELGIMHSFFHNAWVRTVASKFGPSYQYSANVAYNNFVWPSPTENQRQHIEWCAQQVLDARANHPDRSLAQMYDGISPMPENPSKADLKKYDQLEYADLKQAHQDLDNAVEAAYGVNFGGDEEKIVAHLFKLYAEATKGEK